MKICMFCGEPCWEMRECKDCWLAAIKNENEEECIMNKKELEEIMERNDFFKSEIESAVNFIADMLETLADKTEKNEPYATNAIKRMRDTAREVRDLEEVFWEAMEDDEDKGEV